MIDNLNRFLALVEEWEDGDTAAATAELDHEIFSDEVCFEIIRKYPYHTGLIAYNEHLSLPVLRKLSKNRSEVISSCIAQRDTLDHELFEKLSRDRKIAVRSCIAYNRKTPLTILKKMYPDAVDEINEALQENILRKEKREKN